MARDAAPVFDEIIHSPNRLRICVLLSTVETMEFAALRADLGVADSVLSKHLATLADAGYVTLTRRLMLKKSRRKFPSRWRSVRPKRCASPGSERVPNSRTPSSAAWLTRCQT